MMTWLTNILTGEIMKKIFGFFFDTTLGQMAALGVLASGVIVGFAIDQRSVGATKAIAELEKKDAKSIELSGKARGMSRSGSANRVLDPYVRSE